MKNKILLILALSISIVSFGQSNCGFTFNTNPGVWNSVSFLPNNLLPHPPYNYLWNFGDGQTSHNVDPTHTFANYGLYETCLTISDSNNTIVCQWCDTVLILNEEPGNCNVGWDTLGNGAVLFNDNPSDSYSVIHWNFGNGDSAIGTPIVYTYPASGTYQVCMTETDTLGTVLCSNCFSILVGATSSSCFFGTYTYANSLTAQFYLSVNPPFNATWDYGDGTTGNGLYPSHTFSTPGTYLVCATTNLNGLTCTYCDSVTVPGNSSSGCTFTSFDGGPSDPNLFHFQSQVNWTGLSYSWDFGDGNVGHGINESHTYTSPGNYLVCLTITDTLGNTIICIACDSVTVTGNNTGCAANFISTSLGLTAYFIDQSNLASATYSWSFGDGIYSDSHFPHHTYSLPGTYNVCLTVTGGGCVSTTCLPVTVDSVIATPACQANFAIVQIAPFEFAVVNLSSGLNISFDWDFGDGAHSAAPYPSHHYNTIGTYVLCLTVSNNSLLCSSMFCDTLTVDSLGNVYFRGTTSSGFNINVVSPQTLTGVEEISSANFFAVYPNPVSSILTISLADELKGVISFYVYALDGRELTSGTFVKKDNILDVSEWSAGAYILETRTAEGYKSHQKIIKE
jgi:PKD repeat protein